ncbi:MAG: hypothetical protein OXI40_15335 [Chloroflexota bacterium]|nr:hypothetical protein [Chloroflexota bacterium]
MQVLKLLKRGEAWQLLLILLLAALVRFGRGDLVEYYHDDAMLATLALEAADGLPLPLTGILSSTGIPNSPASVYWLTIPFAIKADPRFAIHFVMLINVIGVGLLWLMARLFAPARIAFVAGLLYAINPWAVLYSRKLWAQEMHTPLILLGLLLLLYGFWRRRPPGRSRRGEFLAQALGLPLLLFAIQFHFAAWSLLPAIFLVLWVGRQRVSAPAALLAALLSILVLLPYAQGLAATLDRDPSRLSDAIGRSTAGGIEIDLDPISHAIMLVSGAGLEIWTAPDQAEQLASRYPSFWRLNFVLAIVAVAGVLACCKRSQKMAFFLSIWALAPVLLLIPGWTPAYAHYLIPSLPALALMTAYGVDWILQRLDAKPVGKALTWVALAGFLGLQFLQWHAVLDYVGERHINYPGFTLPLSKLLPLRDRLRQADDVLVISQGMSWNLHHEVAVWDTLLWEDVSCARTLVPQGYAAFPDHAFTVLIAPDAPIEPRDSLYAKADLEIFPTRAGERGYYVFDWNDWNEAPDWQGPSMESIDPVSFSNGVQLTGYGFHRDEVLLEWRLPGRRVGLDYQYSAQLYDEEGARLGQWDSRFWHGRHWCAGDRLLTWGPLAIDDSATSLKVAMYTLGSGKYKEQFFNAEVLDELDNPAGQSADIPLVQRG